MGEIMSVEDDELTQIREARRAEMQSQIDTQVNQQAQAEAEQVAAEHDANMLDDAMRIILTPQARDRLARVELGRPELAKTVKQHLYTLHQTNQIQIPIGDEMLKRILQGLTESTRRETTIRRI